MSVRKPWMTKRYIDMCADSFNLNLMWRPRVGDYYITKEDYYKLNYDVKRIENESDLSEVLSNILEYRWIPTLSDLIEVLVVSDAFLVQTYPDPVANLFILERMLEYLRKVGKDYPDFTFEEAALMFTMHYLTKDDDLQLGGWSNIDKCWIWEEKNKKGGKDSGKK